MYTPTSIELFRMLERAEGTFVPVVWLMEQLGPRSFGFTFFVMGLVALLPGASIFIGVMLAWPALQLMTGQDAARLPRIVGKRTVEVERLVRVIGIVAPRLARLETLIRPRWPDFFLRLRRLTGLAMLLLGLAMMSPVPFSHVLPALVIMLLALAYLEDDGLVLLIALVGALGTLAVTAAAVWGAVATIDWLDPAAGA
jgi:hypothetical protein